MTRTDVSAFGGVLLLCLACLVTPAASQGAPCPYATWTVESGTWYTGMSQKCYCDNGNWMNCAPTEYAAGLASPNTGGSPPMYGQCNQNGITYEPQAIQTINGQSCICIGSQWQCESNAAPVYSAPVYSPPVYSPPVYTPPVQPPSSCWDVASKTNAPSGSPYTNAMGQICTCNDGYGSNCYFQSSPPPPPAGCWDASKNTNVPSGGWFTDGYGQNCYCNAGSGTNCYAKTSPPPPKPPPTCWDASKKISVGNGASFTNGNGQICVCSNGVGSNCYTPQPEVKTCWDFKGETKVYQGATFTNWKGEVCTCNNGEASGCYTPYYASCWDSKDQKQVPHGSWFTSSSSQTCYCNNGNPTLCKAPVANGCYYNGYSVKDGDYIDTADQRCLCSNGQLKFCKDLCQAGKMQLSFIFDTSTSLAEDDDTNAVASIGKKNWDSMRKFTSEVIETVPIGYNQVVVSYTNFDDDVDTRISFTNPVSANKNELLYTLFTWNPEIKGNTMLGEAMQHVSELYQGYDSAKVMVILTDGDADDNIQGISQFLKQQGFIVFAVGVGNVEFNQLAVLTGGNYNRVLLVDDFDELADNLDFLQDAVCQNYGY